MALKAGQKGILLLGTSFEEPRWREALVLKVEGRWLRTLVRCTEKELEATELTAVRHAEATFCLVEAETKHLQLGTHEEYMKLATDPKALLIEGRNALESGDDDLQFASAVEIQKGKSRRKKQEETSSSSSSEEDEMDPLAALRKSWLGDGTGSGRKQKKTGKDDSRRSRRFALIEKKKKKKESENEDDSTAKAVLKAAASSGDPLHGLLALQLSQSMRKSSRGKKGKKAKAASSASHSEASEAETSSSESSGERGRGHAKAVRSYRKSGRKKFRHPLRYVRRYVRGIEEELGAQDRPFRITDHNRKISFGKQQNLKRAHYLVGTILEMLLKEEYNKAALQAVLVLQAMHQCALDQSWEVAWLLTHQEDPFRARVFGGDPDSLQHVTGYLKSMSELAKNADQLRRKGSSKGENDEQQKDGKGKGRGKQKDKDREKPQTEN